MVGLTAFQLYSVFAHIHHMYQQPDDDWGAVPLHEMQVFAIQMMGRVNRAYRIRNS